MGDKFYPDRFLKQVMPKSFYSQNLVDKDFDLKKNALKAINRARTIMGRPIDTTVYNVLSQYEQKYKGLIADGESSTQAFNEAVNGSALLRQRIEQAVVYDEIQNLKAQHTGEFYRWLPSGAANPDPEHQLLYGKIFRVGEGDKNGNMPGERYGCQCGIEWIGEEEAFKEFAGLQITGNYKGQRAVRKMLKEQNGYIKNAFKTRYKDNISLIWGNERIGFDHLIRGRSKQFPILEFLKDFSSVIKNGRKYPNKYSKTRFDLWDKKRKKLVVIETVFGTNKRINFPVTMVKQKNTPIR